MPTTAEQAIKLVREGKAQFTEEVYRRVVLSR